MKKRIIEIEVNDEYVVGSGVVIGAAGSHDDVTLRIKFNDTWIGLNLYATFRNANGEAPTLVAMPATMLVDGEDMTYDVNIPAAAKQFEGRATLTLTGYTIVNGTQEDTATNTATAYFRVLPSDFAFADDGSIDATLAAQAFAAIDNLCGEFTAFKTEVENAESDRVSAEAGREAAEMERVSAEAERVAAEMERVAAINAILAEKASGAFKGEKGDKGEKGGLETSKAQSGEALVINDVSSGEHTVKVNLTSDTVTDFSGVVVTAAGKNLFTTANAEHADGITVEEMADGSIKIINSTTSAKGVRFYCSVPVGVRLTFNRKNGVMFIRRLIDGSWTLVTHTAADKPTATILTKSSDVMIEVFVPVGESIIEGLQIEVGESVTEYNKPSAITTYNADSDGNVAGVKSVSPTMTIFTDTSGVVVNAEYMAEVGVKQIEEMVSAAEEKIKQEFAGAVAFKSKVAGYKMAVIGDSITTGMYSLLGAGDEVMVGGNLVPLNKAFWQQIRDRYGIAEVINNAKTGASFTKDGSVKDEDGNIVNRRFTTYLNETDLPSDLDIIIVFGGTNDTGAGTPFGALDSEPSTANYTNFHGAVRAVLEYLTAHFSEKEIVFVTPLQKSSYYNAEQIKFNKANTEGKCTRDYVNAIKILCADYGVTCIDLYSNSKFHVHDREFLKTYMPDGLHPSVAGTDRYLNNGVFPALDRLWMYRESDVINS